MAEADAWVDHLRRQCTRWRRRGLPITLHVHRLQTRPPAGASVEAWARRERYVALATLAREAQCDAVLLAHHRRDQAETFLLQALRGGAPRGLAGMGEVRSSHDVHWLRPWLAQPRSAIEAYVKSHRLSFVDDASNVDRRYARSRLRGTVWPALLSAFPDAEVALAAAAARAHETAQCLEALADIDLIHAFDDAGRLDVQRLMTLSRARQRNALRHALQRLTARATPQTLIDRLGMELSTVRFGRWPAPGGELRLHDGRLDFLGEGAAPLSPALPTPPLDLRAPGRYRLGGVGTLVVSPSRAEGVEPGTLASVQWRARRGGERFQFGPASTPRSLKKQYQARRVPAWARDAALLYAGERLVFAPGLGIDARVRAEPGRAQLALAWEPAISAKGLA